MHRSLRYASIALVLALALLTQPLLQILSLTQSSWLSRFAAPAVYAQEPTPDDGNIFLPIVADGELSSPPRPTAPPTVEPTPTPVPSTLDFAISSPTSGQSVSGVIFFAVQPIDDVDSVTFRAGEQTLDTDSDGADGFRIFVNTSDLPAGATEFSAVASGPAGSGTQAVTANIVANAPQSATIGQEGGVLASEIGSVISILPGSVPDGTTVSVDELTQEETTERHGIDWDSMGVTFLGAQDVQSSAPIEGPFGMVASAGFGNRVQPGQAVVNYRIAPDADGDGRDEIVVVNTASVAPNGDVLADPIVQTAILASPEDATLPSGGLVIEDSLPPGSIIGVAATGFNPISTHGNVAIYRSDVDSTTVTVPVIVTVGLVADVGQAIFTQIPPLSEGSASVRFQNLSSGFSTEKIELQIASTPPLQRPAQNTVDAALGSLELWFKDRITELEEGTSTYSLAQSSMQNILELQGLIQESDEDLTAFTSQLAGMIENSHPGDLNVEGEHIIPFVSLSIMSLIAADQEVVEASGKKSRKKKKKRANDLAETLSAAGDFLSGLGDTLSGAADFLGKYTEACQAGLNLPGCPAPPQPEQPPQPSQPSEPPPCESSQPAPPGPTGMGAAPPPGGPGCGGAGGGGGGGLLAANQSQQPSPVMVKIFSGGNATPFTGMTDPGGYFFVPFIPADEPFTALAIDTATGDTRTFEGIGPATGESVYMFFDFFNDDGSGVPRIEVGDVVTGEIEISEELDLYLFTATPGQRIYFDKQESTLSDFDASWELRDVEGSLIFRRAFRDEDTTILERGGQYTLSVSADDGVTGTYQFQLLDVPAPQEFTINIGDVVSSGVPDAGAGNIEAPGVVDVYRFTATAGQQVYFDLQQSDLSAFDASWELHDEGGDLVFRRALRDEDTTVLQRGGIYVLTVDADNTNIGTYQFQILDVPLPQEFTINIGDVVSNGVPGAGAGNIEAPGVVDVYRFTATAGQQVYFDLQQSDLSAFDASWELHDEGGDLVFRRALRDEDTTVLQRGGIYVLTVDADNTNIGTYQFQILDVPLPQEFTINIGDVVSNGVPGTGAGNIEAPGVVDVYRFTATAGQQVYFDLQQSDLSAFDADWELRDEGGDRVFGDALRDRDTLVLQRGGLYTLTVDADGTGIGTYQFQILNVPAPQEFTIEIGDVISNGVPAAGAGNIESPGVVDIYRFTATAGQQVSFDVQQSDFSFLDADWELYDEEGDRVFGDALRDRDTTVLQSGGLYTLTIDADGTDIGTYQFQILNEP